MPVYPGALGIAASPAREKEAVSIFLDQILAPRVVSFASRLLIRCTQKDGRVHAEAETSFLANLDQNIRIVHRVCHTYFPRDAVEREDVFQDIMYQLWKSYPQFKGESKFSTWMYKVALNTAITHIRQSTRTRRNAELTESVVHASHINEHIDRVEEVHHLHEAIAQLTDIDKAIILLSLEDQTYDEIASITGLTKSNVSFRLVRIKRALKT